MENAKFCCLLHEITLISQSHGAKFLGAVIKSHYKPKIIWIIIFILLNPMPSETKASSPCTYNTSHNLLRHHATLPHIQGFCQ
jgi:hypothetical protein